VRPAAHRLLAATRRPWFLGVVVMALLPVWFATNASGGQTSLGRPQGLVSEPPEGITRTKALVTTSTVGYHAVMPARLVDTRTTAKIAPGAPLVVPVAGVAGVPAHGATSVVVTLTATEPEAPGFVTIYACGRSRPAGANVTYAAGQTVSSMATVLVGTNGAVCLDTLARTHVVAEVIGWYGAGGMAYAPVEPSRIYSGRLVAAPATAVVVRRADGGLGTATTTVKKSATTTTVKKKPGPTTTTTVKKKTGPTTTTTVKKKTGPTTTTTTKKKTGATTTTTTTKKKTGATTTTTAARSTSTTTAAPAAPPTAPAVATNAGVTSIAVAGRNGVAVGSTAAVVAIGLSGASAAGFVTVYACGQPRPAVASASFDAGKASMVTTIASLAPGGATCIAASSPVSITVDLAGWFGPGALGSFGASAGERLVDTRSTRPLAAGTVLRVAAGDVSAVALQVTVVGPSKDGSVTVWPCGLTQPALPSVVFRKGETTGNAAVTLAGSDGNVCVATTAATNLTLDLAGQLVSRTTAGLLRGPSLLVLQWGLTQVGSAYAAINPYRFGDSLYGRAWECAGKAATCTKVDMHGKARTVAAGSYVYDCSGLVVAAWLRAGVDLVKRNAAWTDPMAQNLTHVTRATAQPGDLVIFNFSGGPGTDHVGIYIDDQTMLHAGTCTGPGGVCLRSIPWGNAVAVVRPQP
jgi:cell wall-associated NlpC family hydrolase